jgi:hypothetical protein
MFGGQILGLGTRANLKKPVCGSYTPAVNEQIKSPQDNPTIGILLCQSKDKIVAEYALKNVSSPMGVSDYKLTKMMPKELKKSLPSIEEIEAELKTDINKK